ncbi:very short patch repair endonuclease [Nocardiopsis eucommiae]|uniref:Very short patch repair endonuclease n=1 Tax=Nocardiopsis eucommiae TaxID=2831970 RepID=A0A975LB16_9ACTN|nr:very short patch repair endonuclease [Nocardiopsis eucommiae]
MTRAARSAEQDRAVGGRGRRVVVVSDGTEATGSVALRVYDRTRRIRAYLRWSENGRTRERYLGEVDADTRAANLARAWHLARAAGLVRDRVLPTDSTATSEAARASMRANKGRDTGPELLLRSLLHARGLRYRVNARPLPELARTADVVFRKARVAVFVDGCYWHGCPEHHRPAKRRAEFWRDKIEGNQARDTDTNEKLRAQGWTVVRVWEHETPETALERVLTALDEGLEGSSPGSGGSNTT